MHKAIPSLLAIMLLIPGCVSRTSPKTVSHQPSTPDETNGPETQTLSKKAKKRQEKTKTLSHKSYDQLRIELEKCKNAGDAYLALKYAEKMYAQCEKEEELCDLLLLCADLCFQQQNYKKASSLYNDFVRLYPSISQKTEHAWYYAILCSEQQQTTTADRDQSMTKETIILAESFLKRSDIFTTHAQQVREVLNRCHQRLVDHELGIVNFYVNRGSLKSADKRLTTIRQEFVPKYAPAEPQLLLQECRLAYAQNNTELGERKALELAAKFPDYLQHDRAKALPQLHDVLATASIIVAEKKPSSFVNRF